MAQEVSIKIKTYYDSKGVKEVQKNLSTLGQKAQAFSKAWGVSIGEATKYQAKLGAESLKSSQKVTKGLKGMTAGVKEAGKGFAYQLTFIAWHFRYLGNIFTRIAAKWKKVVKESIDAAAELQESFLSIEVAAAMYGQSAEDAIDFTRRLALTGLLPLMEAATSVKNLVLTGLGIPQLKEFSLRYLDVAFLMTSGMDEMQKSLEVISKSILRGTLVLSTDVTARMLWTETEKRLQRTMGVGMKQLSAKQKLIEILTTINKEYAETVGLHEMEEETLRATLNRLTTSVTLLKKAYGDALAPVMGVVAEYIGKVTTAIVELIPKINSSVALITVLGLAITTLIGSIAFGIGILISFYNIFRTLNTMLGFTIISFGKLALITFGLSAILIAGTYIILRHTGAWEKMKASMAGIAERIAKLKAGFQDLGKTETESMEIDEGRAVSHRRNLEDIEEDLEKERSKGLWANQMAIKDLEKRKRRENEDWELYLKERGTQTGEETGLFGKIQDAMSETSDALKGLGEDAKEMAERINWSLKSILGTVGEVITEIMRKFAKLPPDIQGLLAGIVTFLGTVWIMGIAKWILKAVKKFLAGFVKIGGAWKGLTTLMATTIAPGVAFAALLAAGMAAIVMIRSAYVELVDLIQGTADHVAEGNTKIIETAKNMWEEGTMSSKDYLKVLNSTIDASKRLNEVTGEILEKTSLPFGLEYPEWMKKAATYRFPWERQFQSGGIVPGSVGQPVPILAHGGERVIPAGKTGGNGGNITINFNNPIVREPADLDRIAQRVGAILGQKTRWMRMGG